MRGMTQARQRNFCGDFHGDFPGTPGTSRELSGKRAAFFPAAKKSLKHVQGLALCTLQDFSRNVPSGTRRRKTADRPKKSPPSETFFAMPSLSFLSGHAPACGFSFSSETVHQLPRTARHQKNVKGNQVCGWSATSLSTSSGCIESRSWKWGS